MKKAPDNTTYVFEPNQDGKPLRELLPPDHPYLRKLEMLLGGVGEMQRQNGLTSEDLDAAYANMDEEGVGVNS